jgi:hypothetical protein
MSGDTSMANNAGHDTSAVSSVSTAAVLKQSIEMPQDAQKVEELNFDDFAGRSITVEDLVNGTSNMGFQASSIGEAVRIINEMVWNNLPHNVLILSPVCFAEETKNTLCREPGNVLKPARKRRYSSATPQISYPPVSVAYFGT